MGTDFKILNRSQEVNWGYGFGINEEFVLFLKPIPPIVFSFSDFAKILLKKRLESGFYEIYGISNYPEQIFKFYIKTS